MLKTAKALGLAGQVAAKAMGGAAGESWRVFDADREF